MLFLLVLGLDALVFVVSVLARSIRLDDGLGDAEPAFGPRGEMILRHGPAYRVYDATLTVLLALSAVLVILYPETIQSRSLIVTALGAGAVLATWSAVGTWRRIEITDDAVTVLPLFGHGASVSWSDVAAVEYSRLRGYLTLRSRHGQQVRVDVELQGFKTFVGLVRELLPDTSHAALTRVPTALYPTES